MRFRGNEYLLSPRFENEQNQLKEWADYWQNKSMKIEEEQRIQREYLELPEHPYGE